MREYHVADLNVRGELLAQQAYRYEEIEQIPGAGDLIVLFSTLIWRSPDEFDTQLPVGQAMSARWRSSAPTAGVLTIRNAGELASLSLLASGRDADADQITLQAFQRHLLRELRDTATEPAFALLDLAQRPLVATINFHSPPEQLDQLVVALADRCFAAAYFRYQNLA